jgi:hypothetical protein
MPIHKEPEGQMHSAQGYGEAVVHHALQTAHEATLKSAGKRNLVQQAKVQRRARKTGPLVNGKHGIEMQKSTH